MHEFGLHSRYKNEWYHTKNHTCVCSRNWMVQYDNTFRRQVVVCGAHITLPSTQCASQGELKPWKDVNTALVSTATSRITTNRGTFQGE